MGEGEDGLGWKGKGGEGGGWTGDDEPGWGDRERMDWTGRRKCEDGLWWQGEGGKQNMDDVLKCQLGRERKMD